MNKNTTFTAAEIKQICSTAFREVFPEVVAMEKCEKEKGKITDSDLRKIFNKQGDVKKGED